MGLNGVQCGILSVSILLFALSTTVVCLRLYDRLRIRRTSLAHDDYTVLFSLTASLGLVLTTIIWVSCFRLGHDGAFTPAQLRQYMIINYSARIFYALTFDSAKIAIIFFYVKITNRDTQRLYWFLLVAILCFANFDAVLHLLILIVPCSPVSDFWNANDKGATCLSSSTAATIINIFNFVSEGLVVLAPIPMLWLAGLTQRQRIALGAMFSLATLIIVASVLKLKNVLASSSESSSASHSIGIAWIWVTVESNVALLVAGFLPLKALLEGTFIAVRRRFSATDTSDSGHMEKTRHGSLAPSDPYDLELIASLRTYPETPQSATMTLCAANAPQSPKTTWTRNGSVV
ncbi:Integral membrane protein [Taphrina deformans PYCC 5710]|uniref:Integral membrane protein n=1 Tax=Taphrina deformans (strain PYCC 5710 / ATCC 11124 / CBS 356.35 / IMI 108563 / JCM 9778 / NBRC 8474) TaxID=1097556 RepID=R4X8K4_TAPDE|nr:Integral membrane protein [Taphrina deformans PYCC 5710]|eukprot:CCG81943.1 Integral membrane protein [Taphrina deformans PYCC 5710]